MVCVWEGVRSDVCKLCVCGVLCVCVSVEGVCTPCLCVVCVGKGCAGRVVCASRVCVVCCVRVCVSV